MKNTAWLPDVAQGFQKPERAHGRHVASGFHHFEAKADVALAGQMVDFFGGRFHQDTAQGRRIFETRMMQEQPAVINGGVMVQVLKTGAFEAEHLAHYAMDFVTFVYQQFRQIRAILPRDTGDECPCHVCQAVTLIRPSRWALSNSMSASTMSLTNLLKVVFGCHPSCRRALL